MTFHYEEAAPRIYRPIIPIFLKSETVFIFYRAIIDSGADNCVFSTNIADLLEIKLSDKEKINFTGVGKGNIEGFKKEIVIKVGSISYLTEVIFAEISDFGHGILGARGFFDHFDVRLSFQNQLIEIIPV